jgi:ABC-type amino acid transport substrate-binding protein
MAESLFEFVATALQQRTHFDKLEARGTVRIALKEAGLDPRSVNAEQMVVMLTRAMPKELQARGVERSEELCQALATAVKGFRSDGAAGQESPEDVFRRLGTR